MYEQPCVLSGDVSSPDSPAQKGKAQCPSYSKHACLNSTQTIGCVLSSLIAIALSRIYLTASFKIERLPISQL